MNNYNPSSPKVKRAKEFAEEFEKDMVVVISIDKNEERIEGTSYGTDKAKCTKAANLMNYILDLFEGKKKE